MCDGELGFGSRTARGLLQESVAMRNRSRTRNSGGEGFTLVEVMIVVGIIGAVAAIGAPAMEHLARQPSTRAWIVDWQPGSSEPPPGDADVRNLELAADLWYSIRRHWCIEGQRAQARPSAS